MKTKYRLLKDLPLAKAGQIVAIEKSNFGEGMYTIFWKYSKYLIEIWKIKSTELSQWVEKTWKPKTVWDLKQWDECYRITFTQIINKETYAENHYTFTNDKEVGNLFLTYEEAEKELMKRQAIVRIQQYCWENNIDTNWNNNKNNQIFYFNFDEKRVVIQWHTMLKPYSPIGYFSWDDAQKILAEFPEELELIYS